MTGAELKAMGGHCGEHWVWWIKADQILHNGNERAFFAARREKVVNSGYRMLHGFFDYKIAWKLKEAQMIFFVHQARFLNRGGNNYTSSCWGHCRRSVRGLLRLKEWYGLRSLPKKTKASTVRNAKKEE